MESEQKNELLARLLDRHRALKNDPFNFNRLRALYREASYEVLKKATAHFCAKTTCLAFDVANHIEKENYRVAFDRKAPPSKFEKEYHATMLRWGMHRDDLKKMESGARAYVYTALKSDYPPAESGKPLTDKTQIFEQIFELRRKYPKVFKDVEPGSELEAFGIGKGYLNA